MIKERKSDIREDRLNIGADILLDMRDEDLPQATFLRVALIMVKYFKEGKYIKDLEKVGYSSSFGLRPSYWNNNRKDLERVILERGYVFYHSQEWVKPDKEKNIPGFFRHGWGFPTPEEFNHTRNQQRKGIVKRKDTYNEKIENAPASYQDALPYLRTMEIAGPNN